MSSRFTTNILRRVLEPQQDGLPADLARYFLSVRFSPEDDARIDELSAKARAGTLTKEEDDELEGFLDVNDFLSIMQSKARVALRIPPPSVATAVAS